MYIHWCFRHILDVPMSKTKNISKYFSILFVKHFCKSVLVCRGICLQLVKFYNGITPFFSYHTRKLHLAISLFLLILTANMLLTDFYKSLCILFLAPSPLREVFVPEVDFVSKNQRLCHWLPLNHFRETLMIIRDWMYLNRLFHWFRTFNLIAQWKVF